MLLRDLNMLSWSRCVHPSQNRLHPFYELHANILHKVFSCNLEIVYVFSPVIFEHRFCWMKNSFSTSKSRHDWIRINAPFMLVHHSALSVQYKFSLYQTRQSQLNLLTTLVYALSTEVLYQISPSVYLTFEDYDSYQVLQYQKF